MKFSDIEKFPNIHYHIDVHIDYVPDTIKCYCEPRCGGKLVLNPDFQRGHVWNEDKQIKYMEYLLKEPTSGKDIYLNHPNWMGSYEGDFVLVDGLQRLTTVLKFCNNELKAYGLYRKEYEGNMPSCVSLSFNIATLKTRKEVLQWYLDFNTGGVIHSTEEINKVRDLLRKEK